MCVVGTVVVGAVGAGGCVCVGGAGVVVVGVGAGGGVGGCGAGLGGSVILCPTAKLLGSVMLGLAALIASTVTLFLEANVYKVSPCAIVYCGCAGVAGAGGVTGVAGGVTGAGVVVGAGVGGC